jgi:Zn ribbon nucleic-acid-binding protein
MLPSRKLTALLDAAMGADPRHVIGGPGVTPLPSCPRLNVGASGRTPEMVKLPPRVRCPQCDHDNFETLGWESAADKLRCTRCGHVFTRRALGADVVNLDAERRKREMRDKSRKR